MPVNEYIRPNKSVLIFTTTQYRILLFNTKITMPTIAIKTKIKQLAETYHQDTIQIRRHLHQHPELSFQEINTAKYIAQQLHDFGIFHETGWADTGIVGLIKGRNPESKTIALRADIDALPIVEKNAVIYKSQNEGVMHACGHDVHTASLLGAARILHTLRDDLEGTIKLIFQPAEEKTPGGASILIKEGVLENPKPVSILGQHVHPPLEVGKVGMRAGKYMASTDELTLHVYGQGGHGALPQDCVDPIVVSAHLIVALQQVVSRQCDPTLPCVLTFGKINSVGGSHNIIPNEVVLLGTLRTMNEAWRQTAIANMKKMAATMAESMNAKAELRVEPGYPYLANDIELTTRTRAFASTYLGAENVVDLPIRMTGEDFAYYSHHMPACFYRLGTGNSAKNITSPVHTDTFDVDEDCLKHSIGLMAWLAACELQFKGEDRD